jgi:hypothetical protein
MFDPEKIERFDMDVAGGEDPKPTGRYMRASDYAQLLQLYRETKSDLERARASSGYYKNNVPW